MREWIYWSMTARFYNSVWHVGTSSPLGANYFWGNSTYGLRPVITIDKSEI